MRLTLTAVRRTSRRRPEVPVPDPSGRPLVVTGDAVLLDDLLRVAATCGTDVEVAADATAARRSWSTAAAVLLGVDAAEGCARARLTRRPGVVLIGVDLDDAGVWQLAVEVGAERVAFLPDAQQWLSDLLADAADGGGPPAAVLGVVGGRGGAGATTLAAALGVTAARLGTDTLLVDADPLGGGIDLVFGGEADRGVRWADLGATRGRVPAAALADALPRMAGLSVLSWDRGDAVGIGADAMQAVLTAGRRAHELVVVDLPRTFDEAARVVLGVAETALLVVPAEVRAAAAASRGGGAGGARVRGQRLVVRGPAPTGLDGGEIARALGLPLAAQLRPEPGLDAALDRGEPPARRGRGPLATFAEQLLRDLVPATGRAA